MKMTKFQIAILTSLVMVICINIPMVLGWYNDTWEYRTNFTITENSGNNLNNYNVRLNINTTDNDQFTNFYCGGERFINSTGNEIDFFRHNCSSSSEYNSTYWIELPYIVSSGTETISLYYGNNSVVSDNSNGTDTFLEYDGFSDCSNWYEQKCVGSCSLNCSENVLWMDGINEVGNLEHEVYYNINNRTKYGLGLDIKFISNNQRSTEITIFDGLVNEIFLQYLFNGFDIHRYLDNVGYKNITNISRGENFYWEIRVDTNEDKFNISEWYMENWEEVNYINQNNLVFRNNGGDSEKIMLRSYDNNNDRASLQFDNFYIRNYEQPEPTYIINVEETIIPTIIPELLKIESKFCNNQYLIYNKTEWNGTGYLSEYNSTYCEYNCSETIFGTRCDYSPTINFVILIGAFILLLTIFWIIYKIMSDLL